MWANLHLLFWSPRLAALLYVVVAVAWVVPDRRFAGATILPL